MLVSMNISHADMVVSLESEVKPNIELVISILAMLGGNPFAAEVVWGSSLIQWFNEKVICIISAYCLLQIIGYIETKPLHIQQH